MKFLCLICAENVMEDMPADDAAQHYDEYAAFTADLRRSGQLVDCNRLLPTDAAVTVRVRNGNVATTDGPYAETKEHFGGYYLIDAPSMDAAIGIAARIPGASRGCVEVRPVADDEQTRQALSA
jgi:hypothetical protein